MTGSTQRLMSLVAVLAVCGIAVSSVSLQHHYATSKTAYCDIGETFNCDIVNRSEYSSIFGIPVALIGMLGYAALLTLTTSVMPVRAPGANGTGSVQVTTWPFAEHAQFVPVADTNPRSLGRMSLTVIVPFVVAVPRLVTVRK